MAKRGLLIGCNYPGTEHALRGCCNDVKRIKDVLINLYEFSEDDLIILMDDEEGYELPTGHNIKASLQQLAEASEPGDVLFIHYSGHGTQVPNKGVNDEADGQDEALVPCDMNLILDDDLKVILSCLPVGVNCTFVSDCCHSGSMLDGGHHPVSGPKEESDVGFSVEATRSYEVEEGGDEETCEGDAADRIIPPSHMLQLLSSMAGSEDGNNDIGGLLSSLFGSDASVKYNTNAEAGQVSASLGDDRMVLISGCQDHETSADCPPSRNKPARGALTDALATVLEQYHESNGAGISNRTLMLAVRNLLIDQRIAQNPCLETTEENADKPFVFFNTSSSAEAY